MDIGTIIGGGLVIIAVIGSLMYLNQKPRNKNSSWCPDGHCASYNRGHNLTDRKVADATRHRYPQQGEADTETLISTTGSGQTRLGSGSVQHGLNGNEQKKLGETQIGTPAEIPAKKNNASVPRYLR